MTGGDMALAFLTRCEQRDFGPLHVVDIAVEDDVQAVHAAVSVQDRQTVGGRISRRQIPEGLHYAALGIRAACCAAKPSASEAISSAISKSLTCVQYPARRAAAADSTTG